MKTKETICVLEGRAAECLKLKEYYFMYTYVYNTFDALDELPLMSTTRLHRHFSYMNMVLLAKMCCTL